MTEDLRRHVLVVGAQCADAGWLDRLEEAARGLHSVLTDPAFGVCVARTGEHPSLLVGATIASDDIRRAVREAVRRAGEENAVLVVAILGHGFTPTRGADLYYMAADSTGTAGSAINVRQLLLEAVDEPGVEGIIALIDTNHAASAMPDSRSLADGLREGRTRLSVLASSAVDEAAFDLQLTFTLTDILRVGLAGAGPSVYLNAALTRELRGRIVGQTVGHFTYDNDPWAADNLWLARNARPTARTAPGATNQIAQRLPAAPAATSVSGPTRKTYHPVRASAQGVRSDYSCAKLPVPDSGQADVFEARHKNTGLTVALKKLHQKHPSERQVARMRREIEIGQLLDGHPHAVPILDSGSDGTWFVMPWASDTAERRQEALQNDPEELRALVDALASVLSTAHQGDWLHRDIKPSNILYLDNRWVLADWGIVRRPRGLTTKIGRTGTFIGTAGFAAPELSVDPHCATPASDIYSVGRVIAWALTGQTPLANVPLLPSQPGPWRSVIKKATQQSPERRPQTMNELIALIEREHARPPEDPLHRATQLLHAANAGDTAAADGLLSLLADHPQDYDLYVGELTQLDALHAGPALARDLPQAQGILSTLAGHVSGDRTHGVRLNDARLVAAWAHSIAAYAADEHEWDLLEEAAETMCIWDAGWNQHHPQDNITRWLQSLQGHAAAAVASVLRAHPDSACHFSELAESRATDPLIRHAVRGR
ncbi:protein kinase [Streptomyces sp. NPDC048629]|uniref:protein kinase domain-containing protein n=1 Tax=Streptomyces sp. NPDC048629 TaxID=3154824 RepID=UPI0034143502